MKKLALVLPLLMLTGAADDDSDRLSAGEWQEITTVVAADGSQLAAPNVARRCIAGDDTLPANYFGRERNPACTLGEGKAGDGRIAMSGSCTDPSAGSARMRIDGRYDATSFTVDYVATLRRANQDVEVRGTVVGKRLGLCPAG